MSSHCRSHARADGRAFARVPANGSSDRADRGAPARAAECAPLLRGRRRGCRHLLDRINPRLLLRPLMAGALILLLLLSTLPLLRKHERLRLSGGRDEDQAQCESESCNIVLTHVSPPTSPSPPPYQGGGTGAVIRRLFRFWNGVLQLPSPVPGHTIEPWCKAPFASSTNMVPL